MVQLILQKSGNLKNDLEAIFRIIEETVPIQQIWLDVAEQKESYTRPFESSPKEVIRILKRTYLAIKETSDVSHREAIDLIGNMYAFRDYPALIEEIDSAEDDKHAK